MNKTRQQLKNEFLRSLGVSLEKVGLQATGHAPLDKKIAQIKSGGFNVGEYVERVDDGRNGRIIELYGNLATIQQSNQRTFRSITCILRKQ